MMFTNRYFVRFTTATEAPGGGGTVPPPEGTPAPNKVEAAEPKVEQRAPEAKPDPIMQQLLQAQQKLDAANKELETQRVKLKTHEREARKSKILMTLREEFPGLPEVEIRGAALVAAEDGHIDLFAEDPAAAIAHMKTALSPKAKKATTSSTASLGGSPGAPGKPTTTHSPKFAI